MVGSCSNRRALGDGSRRTQQIETEIEIEIDEAGIEVEIDKVNKVSQQGLPARIARCQRMYDVQENVFEVLTEPSSRAQALVRTALGAVTAFGDMFERAVVAAGGSSLDGAATSSSVTTVQTAGIKLSDLSCIRPALFQLVGASGRVNTILETSSSQLQAAGGGRARPGKNAKASTMLKSAGSWARSVQSTADVAISMVPEMGWAKRPCDLIIDLMDKGEALVYMLRNAPELIEEQKTIALNKLLSMGDALLEGPLEPFKNGLDSFFEVGDDMVDQLEETMQNASDFVFVTMPFKLAQVAAEFASGFAPKVKALGLDAYMVTITDALNAGVDSPIFTRIRRFVTTAQDAQGLIPDKGVRKALTSIISIVDEVLDMAEKVADFAESVQSMLAKFSDADQAKELITGFLTPLFEQAAEEAASAFGNPFDIIFEGVDFLRDLLASIKGMATGFIDQLKQSILDMAGSTPSL